VQALAAFAEQVRQETDLEVLTADLVEAIQETMQPEGGEFMDASNSSAPQGVAMIAALRKTDWFYRFMLLYTGFHLVWGVVLFYDFFSHPFAPDPFLGSTAYRWFIVFGMTTLSLTISIMVMRRTPGNVTGLCLLLWSVLNLGQAVPVDSPLNIYNGAYNTGWVGLWLLALFFPNGRAYPLRFERWIRWLSVWTVLIISVWKFFQPTVNNWNSGDPATLVIANPLFIHALGPLQPAVNILDMISLGLVILLIIPSMLLRYRASNQTERLQIKWLGWTYGLLITSLFFFVPSGLISGNPHQYGIPGLVAVIVFSIYIGMAPYLAVGNAILRHRLYDINIIIRKTLTYSILTVLLGLVYFGSVVVLQALFNVMVGEQSTAAIVISTLAIAALFSPLRSRIQAFIDRRFYRQKYNAEQALAEFATAARAETDLDELVHQLAAVVQASIQPQHTAVWLRPPLRRTKEIL
jgi:hypothetical protein